MDPRQFIRDGIRVEHLKIGECIFTSAPVLISTVLGSCVSATLYHRPTRRAGMFHAMLPSRAMNPAAALRQPCKYADSAVMALADRFRSVGVPLGELEVKLFGGGFTIDPERKGLIRDMVDVGRKNVESARQTLGGLGLVPEQEDVLGKRGRKVYFHVPSGDIWVGGLSFEDVRQEPSPAKGAA